MKSTGFRKLVSILLSCVLVFSLCGITAFATEEETSADTKTSDTPDSGGDTRPSDTPDSGDTKPSEAPVSADAKPSAAQTKETPATWPVLYYVQNASLNGYAVTMTGQTADESSVTEASAEQAFNACADAGFYHFSRIETPEDGSCVRVYFDLNHYTFAFDPDGTIGLGLVDLSIDGKASGNTSVDVYLGKTIDWPSCTVESEKIGKYNAPALKSHTSFTGWQRDGGNICSTGHNSVTAGMIQNGSQIPATGSKIVYAAQYSLAGIQATVHYQMQKLDGKTYVEDANRESTISIGALTALTGKAIEGFTYESMSGPSAWDLLVALIKGDKVNYYLKYDRAKYAVHYYDGAAEKNSEQYLFEQPVTVSETLPDTAAKKFAAWIDGDGKTVTSFTMPGNDVYLYAKWTPTGAAETGVTVRWYDGSALLKTDSVASGKTPAYTGAEPARAEDNDYTYAFSGWNTDMNAVAALKTIPAVTGDTDFYAIFTRTAKSTPAPTPTASAQPETYTVTFKNWNGDVLKTQSVESGKDATPPTDPVRDGYTFTGWDRAYTNITASVTVTAQFSYNGGGYSGGGVVPTPSPTPTPAVTPTPTATTIPDSEAPKGDQPAISPGSSETPATTIPDDDIPRGDQPANGGSGGAPKAQAPVTIHENETPLAASNSPKTGDGSHLGLFAILAAVSAAGLAANSIYGKKKEQGGDR